MDTYKIEDKGKKTNKFGSRMRIKTPFKWSRISGRRKSKTIPNNKRHQRCIWHGLY
jgi:hypothetical protein